MFAFARPNTVKFGDALNELIAVRTVNTLTQPNNGIA